MTRDGSTNTRSNPVVPRLRTRSADLKPNERRQRQRQRQFQHQHPLLLGAMVMVSVLCMCVNWMLMTGSCVDGSSGLYSSLPSLAVAPSGSGSGSGSDGSTTTTTTGTTTGSTTLPPMEEAFSKLDFFLS
eukprot:CAMPEP_0168293694 /NCGR_PEP_ID=MMETSP0142_2-20121227/8119_1 /TAXON_ID=44445 /ORGANISM="Pseudo-nitzschia australis, Strain 10249 10 AB" /LENGTH=129 /DNA_ID=CAMNT_0008241849 /DNA_START=79 /DNA_END=464 /DNA_ORIENTATION=+